jgi:aspartyl-tRNA(Asn)/glutamyl-tRNA(Gln) amidotransferase subunit A
MYALVSYRGLRRWFDCGVSEIHELEAVELIDAFSAGELTKQQAVRASLVRAEAVGPRHNAFTELRSEAVDESTEVPEGPLSGIPIALKDMFVDEGRPPTVGSNVHGDWMSGTADVIERLRGAGAVIVGYTNLHEWAIGTTSVNTALGPIRNPWDLDLVAGGSSGGSAVSVATGITPLAVGTDAGGSIRVPSACCGIVGLKPTFGRVPMGGYVEGPDAPRVDHIGPMARSVRDVRLLYEVMSGQRIAEVDASPLKVGIERGYFAEDVEEAVALTFERAIEIVKPLVAQMSEVEVADVRYAGQAVAASLLPHTARLLATEIVSRPEDFQPATLNVLRLGQALSGQDELEAENIRRRILIGWQRAFTDVDVIITPTIPASPCTIEGRTVELRSGVSSADLAYTTFNSPMNLAGVPSLSLPVADLPNGLPFNISLTARQGREDVVLALGRAIEIALDGSFVNRLAGQGSA